MENTSTKQPNPLSKYFRQPSIYIKLPSEGKYWGDGSLDLPINNEIPVYPMTARDEVTLRTPDALMNGSGVVEVIQSCCPSIKNAWEMPSIDLDAVLMAIRIASYGHEMDIDANCPKCKEENNFVLDLRELMGKSALPNYQVPVNTHGLVVVLKPQKFFNINKKNSAGFEEQKIIESINDSTLSDEEKVAKINQSMARLLDVSMETITNSTESITVDGVMVTDKDHIKDFYNNADGAILRDLQKRLAEISDEVSIKPMDTVCKACATEFKIPIEFEYANFFGTGS